MKIQSSRGFFPSLLLKVSLSLLVVVGSPRVQVEIFAAHYTFVLTTRVYPVAPDSEAVRLSPSSPTHTGVLFLTTAQAFSVQ